MNEIMGKLPLNMLSEWWWNC